MDFPDVGDGHWAYDAILWGVETEIISGFDDGTFRPEDSVSRAQLMTILKNYHDNVCSGSPPPPIEPPVSNIPYKEVILEDRGSSLGGSIRDSISVADSKFYKMAVPNGRTILQIAISGSNPENVNMVVSNRDFGVALIAEEMYDNFLETYGYENRKEIGVDPTYWFNFSRSFESEYVNINSPEGGTYYIALFNEGDSRADFRLEGHVW
jgi:hypothetical protein